MLADMRCPSCDSPISGHEEVAIVTTPVQAEAICQRCGLPVVRVEDEEIGGVSCTSYRLLRTPRGG